MLNLEAKTKSQELILAYLEQNATEALAKKINNGTPFEKDGKPLTNKKTLDGFMTYAGGEAKKIAEQGTTSACVEDSVVYGWAMHYFEEDSIEGTLYTLDGSPYSPPKPARKEPKKPITSKPVTPPKPQERQASLFDMLTTTESPQPVVEEQKKPTLEELCDYNIDDDHDNDEDDEDDTLPSDEEIREIMAETAEQDEQDEHVVVQPPEKKPIPMYERYLNVQKEYPTAVVTMRLGDFYEVFGGNAVQVAGELNLTLTGRDCGLQERIPMIGFPYHAADVYLVKIRSMHDLVVYENDEEIIFMPKCTKQPEFERHWIDENTYVDEDGVMHTVNAERKIPECLTRIFGNKIIAR